MPHIEFTKATKIFFWIFLVVLILSVAATYYKYIVLEDYEVFVEFDEEGNLINIEE